MAERIKGLQIDLSMRDVNISKTLAGVKREFRALNSDLKLSSNNFKYGEKSANAYRSRMNDLDGAIKQGTANLDSLKSQYEEVARTQGANSARAVRLRTEYNNQAIAVNKMRDEYSRLNSYYRENFSIAGRLSNSFKSVGSNMQNVGQQAQNLGSSLTSKITKPALVAGTAMAGITAKLGFDRLVGLDTAKAKLEGLGYSTKEVGSITDQVTHAIQGGMTTMAEGTDVAAGALAAGVKQGKELEKYIKLVGDAAVGSNRPVSEMAMIFNRVQGQGKLMTQELNMIEEGMPGFSNAMAKHLGVSYDAFREMVTNGEVSSKEFLTVMDDFAGGMANAYSKSWKGMVQNSKAYIGQIGEAFLSSTFEQAKGGLHEFESMLKSPGAKEWAAKTGEQLGNTLASIGNGIKGLIDWWQNLDGSTQKTLGGIVKWLGITLVTMGPVLTIFGKMASTIGGMFSGMSNLIQFFIRHNGAAKVSAASQAIWNGVTATARGIANGYRLAISALSTSQTIQALKTKIAAAATTAWTAVTKGAALATKGLGLAIRFMTGPVGIVITAIGLLVAGLIHLWKTNSSFRNSVITAWNAIKNSAVTIFGFIKTYIVAIWNAIKASTIAVWNGIKTVAVATWNGIKFAILHPIKTLKTILSTIWNAMKNSAIKIWTALKNGVIAIIKAYVAQVKFNINLIKRIVVTIFNAIKNFSIKVWTALKNAVLGIVRTLRKGVLSVFNALKKGVSAIFNAIKNATVRIWTAMKNTVINRAKALWSGVRNTWNALKKGTIAIFKAVGSFMSSKWNSIKKSTVNKAKALWSGVKGAWGSLKKGTHNTMNAVGGFMSKKWNGIKSTTVSIVNGMKSKVMGTMNKMRDGIKTVTGKIGNLFGGMVKGVKKGLNALIKGVNWVGKKLNMDPIPPIKLHTGTESTHTQSFVTNGKLNRDTFATVGDKGRGNGPSGFRHETIIPPKGKPFITPGKDTTMPLSKGTRILNGAQTHSLLNQGQFSTGTIPRFASGTKKNMLEAMGDEAGKFFNGAKKLSHSAMDNIGDKTEQVKEWGGEKLSQIKVAVGKGTKWLSDKIGDIADWVGKPGKLLNKVLEAFGVNMDAFGIAKSASLPYDLMKGMFGKLKEAAKNLISGWFEEEFSGGGGYNPYANNSKFQWVRGWTPNGHAGIDYGAATGTPIPSPIDGKVIQSWFSPNQPSGGNETQIWDGHKYTHIFMHQSKRKVKTGDRVHQGQIIGLVGDTGNSFGSHLHWQVNKGKGYLNNHPDSINPLTWAKQAAKAGGGVGGSGSANARRAIQRAQSILGGRYKSSYITEQMMRVAKRESNFQADAVNNWDVNARMGDPSKGMFQMIGSSFRAYAKPGHGNILNPTDEAISAMRYIVGKWVPIMGSWRSAFKRAGDFAYATGGVINTSGMYQLAEGGYPEIVIPTDPSRQSDAMKLLHLAASKISGNNRNKRPNQLRTPSVTSNTVDNADLLLQMIENQQKQINVLMEIARSNENIEKQPKGFSERDVSQAQGSRLRLAAYSQGGL
ncbi:phage tail tape measure protein [Staphylococcus epidermidis]|uniref:peptidoglycan DD-metalloendopeptidase family protein n=1 Tax=Staphylococcus epidermidis TaxID=1282 RepID=UPI0007E409B1|nr:peptidoglycan DD-metalloendopeptidase family protein [Staphylococcus epidermidis]MBM5903550.1 peptidoglycan DD-metalloendopeptidase family protein [Staphylococcus epidermidis]MBM5919423.1 peptidoglycan DD-metalloendopeptidase family protein [Staphylococcus epidermidis]MBM5930845.1 peptidoglycan DD-metalloendopeptidase family protein [Staphylococcus epidermidis]MBM6289281.1 peptidoglycan DD-metalloendopeptidase family protein [Staphylococcus epidermidis]MBM6301250.1 peptidoglycan DD-metalloe